MNTKNQFELWLSLLDQETSSSAETPGLKEHDENEVSIGPIPFGWLPLDTSLLAREKYDIKFKTSPGKQLDENELSEISILFSENYGIWSSKHPKNPGQPIRLSKNRIKNIVYANDIYVAMALHRNLIIGHAIYLRKKYESVGIVTWVLQLVVHKKYRRNGIAKKLLNSIWGFSNDSAWGLATVNPITIKTLERSTYRKCDPRSIKSNLNTIIKAQADIEFANSAEIEVTDKKSVINTEFHIDLDEFQKLFTSYGPRWLLGQIEPGWEWLAFTFKHQKPNLTKDQFNELVMHSENILKEAYSRMRVQEQPWARNAEGEILWILEHVNLPKKAAVIDIGCGTGRHCIALAKRNYNCIGIDFSDKNIEFATNTASKNNVSHLVKFLTRDARDYTPSQKFDIGLLLYDVVGSFANDSDNIKIVKNTFTLLNDGGFIALSVMNMELTLHLAKNITASTSELIEKLPELPASNIMQSTGNVFAPDYYLVDSEHNIVYRKEQFEDQNQLSVEYIVRDKRYTMSEICTLIKSIGFNIIESRYVQACNFNNSLEPTDIRAKEILILAQKPPR